MANRVLRGGAVRSSTEICQFPARLAGADGVTGVREAPQPARSEAARRGKARARGFMEIFSGVVLGRW